MVKLMVSVPPAVTLSGADAAKPAAVTTWLTAEDVLVAKDESPLYTAVMGCVATERVVVVNAAVPPAPRVTVPPVSSVPLSRKLTLPVGVPFAELVTVAVNVTDCAPTDGFRDDANVVVVALRGAVIVSVSATEIPPG
jgi:hypothetical protein